MPLVLRVWADEYMGPMVGEERTMFVSHRCAWAAWGQTLFLVFLGRAGKRLGTYSG